MDDDEAIRTVVSEVLQDVGYDVAEARNGAEALHSVQERPPAVIVLDMFMPVMDGWRFAHTYRALPGPHAPIVCVTAAQDAAQRGQQIEAAATMGKPFEVTELLTVIAQLAA